MDVDGLSVTCSALGFTEEDENGNRIGYTRGQYCSDSMKDLLRFLRRDDPQTREVFKQVCKWKIVAKDVIPIIEHCQDDHALLLNAVKVLVFLTLPIEFSSSDVSQQMEYLWELKSSITCSNSVPMVMSLLEGPLENLQNESFTEDDWKLAQLVLTLFQNVLAIQDVSLLQKTGCSATQLLSIRDRLLEILFHENMMEIILILIQHAGESRKYLRQHNFLFVETLNSIFIGQDPAVIAQFHQQDNEVAGYAKKSFSTLNCIILEEEEKKKLIRHQNMRCHSQFGGTFIRFAVDGSRTVMKGKPSLSTCDTLPRPYKAHRSRAKKIMWDHEAVPSSQEKILKLLHDFITQLLSGGYNVLMQTIREDIERERYSADNCEISSFFQVAQFIMSFQYHKRSMDKPMKDADFVVSDSNPLDNTCFNGDICGPVAETINESMFSFVFSKWRDAFDGLKQTNNYKILSVAGSLMKIMIRLLDLVLKLCSDASREPQTARVLLYKLFYDQTEEGLTQFLLNQMKSFDYYRQQKSYLADLLEILHVLVGMMEILQAHGTLRVSKKSRRKAKKVNSGIDDATGRSDQDDTNIERKLYEGEIVDLTSREAVKPDNLASVQEKEVNRTDTVGPEVSMFKANITEKSESSGNERGETVNSVASADDFGNDEQLIGTTEVEFKSSSLVSAFANSVVINNLCWLLRFYRDNSSGTNHYIVSMFRRICDDMDLCPLFYQLSFLTVFYDILAEEKSNPCEEYEDIVCFLTTLTRRMLRKLRRQPLLFVEVLFHKTRKECADINADSVLLDLVGFRNGTGNCTGYSDPEQTRSLSYTGAPRNRADALGEDEADVVIFHELNNQSEEDVVNEPSLTSQHNARKGKVDTFDMKSHITEETTISNASGCHHEVPCKKKRLVLSGDLEKKVRELHDKFKSHKRCSFMIAKELDPNGAFSASQVSRKLKKLGLVMPRPSSRAHMEVDTVDGDDYRMSDDDVPLSHWKRKISDEASKEINSDDEVLGSIIKRSRQKKGGGTAPISQSAEENDSLTHLEDGLRSVQDEQKNASGISLCGEARDDEYGDEGVNVDHIASELEDPEDEISAPVSTEIRNRRRGKMILDFDDE